MKKYKLNIMIRKGFEDTPFMDCEINTESHIELFQLKKLITFKDDAYLTVTLDEIPEEKSNV